MPDSQIRRERDFSQYDAMDEEQLQQILREDASKPEGEESDMEMLLYVMEVLAKRRKERNEEKDPEAALDSFKKNYCTNDENSLISESTPAVRNRSRGLWRRGLIAIAASLVLVIGCSITANALGFDVWETIAKWTQETFHFDYAMQTTKPGEPSKDEEYPYAELQEALLFYEITETILPTWIPEGYEEVDVRTFETPMQRQIVAKYQSDGKEIKIWIADYLDSFPDQIEQSNSLVEVYTSSGIDYYIFENNSLLQAVWINKNFECYISGPLTLSEITEMIDSIEKG